MKTIDRAYVTLVQPERSFTNEVAFAAASVLLRATMLRRMAPVTGIWSPSFGQALAAVFAARSLVGGSDARALSATVFELTRGRTR